MSSEHISHAPKPILLVEDDPLDADLTIRAFKKIPLENQVIWKRNGDQALDFLRQIGQRPVLVLLDLNMPGKDGITVLNEIRAQREFVQLPVVIFSSSKERTDVEACYAAGGNAYVSKPIDTTEFREVVKSLGLFWTGVNVS